MDIFSIFSNLKVSCVFSLESLIEAILMSTHNIPFSIQKKTLNYPKSAAKGSFSKGLKSEFEIAMVNEPSVFEPLKFYCKYSKLNGKSQI